MHTIREARVFLYETVSAPTALPLENSAQRDRTHIIQRSIRADRASRLQVTHLAHDRGDAARTQPRRAAPDQLGERAEELAFGERRLEREKVREDADDHQQFLRRVHLHQREEGGVQRIRNFDLVRVLAQEEHAFIDQLADNETQDLPQITTGDQFLIFRGTRSRLEGIRRREAGE